MIGIKEDNCKNYVYFVILDLDLELDLLYNTKDVPSLFQLMTDVALKCPRPDAFIYACLLPSLESPSFVRLFFLNCLFILVSLGLHSPLWEHPFPREKMGRKSCTPKRN